MPARFSLVFLLTCVLLTSVAIAPCDAVPLLAVDFGGTYPKSELQSGMQGMWGTNDPVTSATFGSYTVSLSANSTQTGTGSQRGFITKTGGNINNTDASIRDEYRDFYFDRSTVNGEGITLSINGLTPNTPYNLTLTSFDPDASPTVSTDTNWGPKLGSNTTGTSTTINMKRTPVPTALWDSLYSGTIQVSTTTGTLDIFGTTSAGARGTTLNGFKLNNGTTDVLAVDLGEGAPNGSIQQGFVGMTGPETTTGPQSQVVGAYTVSVEGIGGGPFDVGYWNERTAGQGAGTLPPETHALYRDYFYNNSTSQGDGVLLSIDGVTPNTDYDVKIWTHDPANPTLTPTVWSPVLDTAGETATVNNIRTPIPQVIDDPAHSTIIRVHSTSSTLNIFGTSTSGTDGTRLNAVTLNLALAGDYNRNGVVDAGDYVVWQKTNGQTGVTPGSGADGDGNGTINSDDLTFWRSRFGNTAGSGSGSLADGAVPEPSTSLLALLAVVATVAIGRDRRSSTGSAGCIS